MNRIAIIAAAALSASFVAAAPAAAEDLSVPVYFGDLDTGSQAGVKTLAERVKQSVNLACERPDTRNLQAGAAWQECRDAASAQAAEQLARQGVVPTIAIG